MPDEIKTKDNLTKTNKIGTNTIGGFAGRVARAERTAVVEGEFQRDNRIVLMLDNSGSMSETAGAKSKLEHLKDAVEGFVSEIDFSTTSVGLYSIPTDDKFTVRLSPIGAMIVLTSQLLDASGGTPLGDTMKKTLQSEALTRGVIVSDGDAHDPGLAKETALLYKEQGIPVDCVHIGNSSGGEALLEEIAQITGGTYIKFKDVARFGQSLKYLTPRYRALLNAPGAAELIGANEVKR